MSRFSPSLVAMSVASALVLSPCVLAEEADTEIGVDDLETIVVSGSRTPKKLGDVAGSVSVVTAEEIESQIVSDMNQLFRYEPGVEVTGRSGDAQNVIVRGMGADRVLMIKDGMRMNEGYGADGLNDIVGRGFIETDTLKQVEVAKGAASSLYGSDALGGIVVFTTKDASDYLAEGETFGGTAKIGYADVTSQAFGGVTLATVMGDWEHLLNLTYRDGEEQKNFEESQQPFTIESTSVLLKSKYHLNKDSFVTFSADLWDQDIAGDRANGLLAYFRGLAPFGYLIDTENSTGERKTQAFKVNYQSEASTPWYDYLNVNLYHNTSEQFDEEYALLDINAPMFGVIEMRDMWKTSNYEQKTVGLLSNASKKLNDTHTLGFGLDIESTTSERTVHEYREVAGESTRDITTNKFPENDTFRAGLFINDEISLDGGKWLITPGVRFDMYEMDPNGALKTNGEAFAKIDENHLSFNLGALYKVNDGMSLFAQYGQGFKVPAYDLAYIEHYNQAASTYIYEIVPSDDLSPEESDTFEIGLRGQTDNLSYTASVYYNDYTNFLATQLINSETVFDADGNFQHQHDTFQYQNIDEVTIKGIEAGVRYWMNDAINVFFNASYQDGKGGDDDQYISSISPLSGTAGIGYQGDKLSSDVLVRWADRMDKVNEGDAEVAGYATVDWQLSYEFNDNLKANLAVNNLLDKEYVRFVNVAGHAEGDSFASKTEPGRNISATIHYTF